MTEDSGSESLLEKISKWDTDNVVTLLQKNGLNECCAAIVERRLDGEGLLSFTERDLNSWENDLAPSSYWNLYRFTVELKNNPEQFLYFGESESKSLPLADSDIFSDSDTWDTDFDTDDDASISNPQRVLKSLDQDCTQEEEDYGPEMQFNNNNNNKPHLRPVPKTPGVTKPSPYLKKEEVQAEEEDEEDENVYANGIELNKPMLTHVLATKSKFEGGSTKTDLGELLQKELRLRERMNKPTVVSKSPVVQNKAKFNLKPASSNRNSFLHSQQSKTQTSKPEQQSTKSHNKVSALKSELLQNLSAVRLKKPDQYPPTPPKSKPSPAGSPVADKKRDLPKPPATSPLLIGKLDLLADLPRSDKNLESIRRHNNQTSLGSTRSHKNSNGISYHPQSVSSVDEDEDTNEDEDEDEESIYERINDPTTLNEEVLQSRTQRPIVFPSLPLNPPLVSPARVGRQLLGGLGSRLADEVADMIVRIKRGLLNCCHAQNSEAPEAPEPPKPPERPPVRKIGNFPPSGNQSSPFDGRVTRPLPSPPDGKKAERPIDLPIRKTDGQTYKDKPWFHDVSREQAEALITGGNSDFGSTPHNGYFLVRPSGYALDRPFTLVLRYKNRPFNIPVRARPDSRYALGSVKPDEQSFVSVEEMVDYHKQSELVLYRNGVPVGNTRLTDTPPRRND